MTDAVIAEGLVKRYGDVTALDGLDLRVPRGHGARPARAQRRRQDHAVRILTTLLEPDAGRAEVAGSTCSREPGEVRQRDRPLRAVRRRRRVPHRLREPRHGRPALPPGPRRSRGAGPRAARAVRPRRGRRPAGQDLLRRHAPPARPGRRAGRRAAGAVPRRADHRPRPAQPHRHVGRHQETSSRGGTTLLLTTQYLEEADRLADHIVGHRPRPGDRRRAPPTSSRRRSAASGSRSPSPTPASSPRPARCWRRSAVGDADGRRAHPPASPCRSAAAPAVLVDALRRLDARGHRASHDVGAAPARPSTTSSSPSPATPPRTPTSEAAAGEPAGDQRPSSRRCADERAATPCRRRLRRRQAQPDQDQAGPRPAGLHHAVADHVRAAVRLRLRRRDRRAGGGRPTASS